MADNIQAQPGIKCIFFAEFHPTTGPKICCQTPDNYMTKEDFDTVHVYIITKPQLRNRLITINALGHKILGCPVCIDDTKYPRNIFIFNMCFVFDEFTNTDPYEAVVKKIAGYLTTLEVEDEFLSKEDSKEKLPRIMEKMLKELNEKGLCYIPINKSNTVHLKVTPNYQGFSSVQDHHVPIFLSTKAGFKTHEWDLTTQQILLYIDGYNHVARIAAEADVEINIVKACLQNLLHFGVITVIPIFQYSNVYTVTPKIKQLAEDKQLQNECVNYVARGGRYLPRFYDVFTLYCGLTPGTTVRDLCTRYNPHSLRVDERKLIQFGLMMNLIKKLHKYPVKLPNVPVKQSGSQSKIEAHRIKTLYKWFSGRHNFDEICCKIGVSHHDLEKMIEEDPNVVVCWK